MHTVSLTSTEYTSHTHRKVRCLLSSRSALVIPPESETDRNPGERRTKSAAPALRLPSVNSDPGVHRSGLINEIVELEETMADHRMGTKGE